MEAETERSGQEGLERADLSDVNTASSTVMVVYNSDVMKVSILSA